MRITEVEERIRWELREIVTSDYILLDLPFFPNVGDIMIWKSTLDLLQELPYKCLYSAAIQNYLKPVITQDILIIFMGGGNFGDLWIRHQLFREKVLADFPNNQIIQLPQSVCFNDNDFLKKDIDIFASHKGRVTLYARERQSFDFLKCNYQNADVRLMPDIAFAFKVGRIRRLESSGSLFVRRNDSEKIAYKNIPKDVDEEDWPTLQKRPLLIKIANAILKIPICFHSKKMEVLAYGLYGSFYSFVIKDYILKKGIAFLLPYATIYSSRFHAGLLAVLLGKKVFFFDNSYGKIKGLYNEWMKDIDNVTLI